MVPEGRRKEMIDAVYIVELTTKTYRPAFSTERGLSDSEKITLTIEQ
jgi:hypothetical protein